MIHRDSVERDSDKAIKMTATIYGRYGVAIRTRGKYRV